MRHEAFGQSGLSPLDTMNERLSLQPIVRLLRRYQNPKVLDLGCGYDARVLQQISPQISTGVGIDLHVSKDAIAHPKLSFYQQPIEETLVAMEPEQFDIVMMISILEHLWDPMAVLQASQKVLRKGGAVIINVPTWYAKPVLEFLAFVVHVPNSAEIEDHKMYFNTRDLWPLLIRSGFSPSRIDMGYHKFGMCVIAVAQKH